MNQCLLAIRSLLVVSVLATLTACATTQAQPPSSELSREDHKGHHPGTSSTQAPGSPAPREAMSTQPDGQMPEMNMKEMCDMHQKMMNASPSERQAMTGGRMSPEMMEKHMQMMREQCK